MDVRHSLKVILLLSVNIALIAILIIAGFVI